MNALIYAPSGGGKTVQSTRIPAPNRGRNALLCSDNSSIVLNQPAFARPNLDIVVVEHWMERDKIGKPQTHFQKQFEDAVDSKKYDNIIVDNLSDLFDLAILEMDESGKYKDMRQAYQQVYQNLKRLARKAGQLDCNVIFTAWADQTEVMTVSGEKTIRISPKLPQRSSTTCLDCVTSLVTSLPQRTQTSRSSGSMLRLAATRSTPRTR